LYYTINPGGVGTIEQVSLDDCSIVVIGASAGGIESLMKLVAGLPRQLRAAIFVVVHQPAWHKSELPQVLARSGGLPALHPAEGQEIDCGKIYVAKPDFHLLLERDHIDLWRGPKENRHRPAVNPLFRSAAVAFGRRVIGVILSGFLDDGATGLWWIRRYGGITVVQDPKDAQSPEMPEAALQHVDVDYVLPASEIGPLLVKLTGKETPQIGEAEPEYQ
jgi:two-component system chemotaxis response regulator CheB